MAEMRFTTSPTEAVVHTAADMADQLFDNANNPKFTQYDFKAAQIVGQVAIARVLQDILAELRKFKTD